METRRLLFAASVAVLAAACGREQPAPLSHESAHDESVVAGPTGVRECDEYIAQYEGCIAKMDDASRATAAKSLGAERERFVDTATTPGGRASLTTTCKAAFGALPSRCK